VPAIVTGCSDPEVPRYIPLIPVPYTERDAREWLAGAEERWRQDRERALAITRVDQDDELLGVVSVDLRPGGSIGYWMRADASGRGLMSEALTAVVRWAEEQARTQRPVPNCPPGEPGVTTRCREGGLHEGRRGRA
jgi:RimJ/RimL family protein N-acetyltransferase